MKLLPGLGRRTWAFYGVLSFISLALSGWSIYQDNVLNDDAVWYLEAADLFRSGEWKSAYSQLGWPLYPLLISLVSQVTWLSLEHAAYFVNAVLYTLVVVVFVQLAQQLRNDWDIAIAAAIVILLYSSLNEYRSLITRDAGYWAFFLLGISCYFRYSREPKWSHALGSNVSLLVASLFRFEGFVFLLLLPWVALARRDLTWLGRMRLLLKGSVMPIVLALFYGLAASIAPSFWIITGGSLGRFASVLKDTGAQTLAALFEKSSALETTLSNGRELQYALPILLTVILALFVFKFIKVVTPVYAILAGYAIKRRVLFFSLPHANLVWVWLVLLNVIILLIFVAQYYLLPGRYLVPLSLLIMLPVPSVLLFLYRQWSAAGEPRLREQWVLPLVGLFLFLMAMDGLVSFGPDRMYIKEAGRWIERERGEISTVFANDQVLLYYTGERGVTAGNRDYSWEHLLTTISEHSNIDYYAIRISRKHPERERVVEEILGEPVAKFGNSRGDKVLVFAGF